MTEVPNVDVTPTVPADHKVGDKVTYTGALGKFDGFVAEVRHLIDETGVKLKTFIVHLEGVGRLLTTGDALAPAAEPTPVSTKIPRSAYSDTSVPPPAATTAVTAVVADEAQANGGDVDAPPAA